MIRARAALISGASTGIGEATARLLAAHGWEVWAGVRDTEAARRLDAVEGIHPVRLDVTDHDAVVDALNVVSEARAEDGLDLLVNNAGIVCGGPLEFLEVEEWERQFAVNVMGVVRLTRQALPLMRRAVDPRVVVVGSIAGRVAAPLVGPYAASKHALVGLVGSLRRELGPGGPLVVLVEPGAVATPLWGKAARTAVDIEAALPTGGRRRYEGLIARQRAALGDGDDRGISAEAVARIIESCARRSRPPARRLVGPDAWLGGIAARLLPDRVIDAGLSLGPRRRGTAS